MEKKTIDDVVRCKDCLWYEIDEMKYDGTDDRRYAPSVCVLWMKKMKKTDYCSRAFPKKDAEFYADVRSEIRE